MKTKRAILAPIFLTLTMALNSCGEKSMKIPNTTVYRFEHKVPEAFLKKPGLSYDEFKPFMDGDIFFWGQAIRNTDNMSDYEFDIGVQFHAEAEGRKIFVEKMVVDTPNLTTDRVINEFVDIDVLSKRNEFYFKRFTPFENISGDSIPLTADFFTLTIDYRLDDNPTKQMSIRFDNATMLVPVL